VGTNFQGGSPVSDASNPYNDGASLAQDGRDILPSLDPEGREQSVMSDLDAYGSSPVTSDSAAERSLSPKTSVV
jgi:hypothetical protein